MNAPHVVELIKRAASAMREDADEFLNPDWYRANADLLDLAADSWEHADFCLDCFHPTCLTVAQTVTLARAYLGEPA